MIELASLWFVKLLILVKYSVFNLLHVAVLASALMKSVYILYIKKNPQN